MMADLLDICRFTAGNTGTGAFEDGTADQGFLNLDDAGAVNGKTYPYRAENATRTEWEIGYGVYDSGAGELSRTPLKSSNSDAAVSFTTAPTVIVTALKHEFQQLSANTRRNRIVNPALQISQENGDVSGTTDAYYVADQFCVERNTSAGTITAQRVQSTTPGGARDRARITITTADTSLAAGEYLQFRTRLEGLNVADLLWGTANARPIVVRFLFNGPSGTYALRVGNSAGNRSYVALFSPSAANTDEIIEIAVPGDTSGTWLTDTGIGMQLSIVLACGSTFQGSAGWQAGNILGTSGVSNGMGTGSAVFELGEFGLYLDSDSSGVAPEWEVPAYFDEFIRSARYYVAVNWRVSSWNDSQAPSIGDSRTRVVDYAFPAPMRVAPSMSVQDSFTATQITVVGMQATKAGTAGNGYSCGGYIANARL